MVSVWKYKERPQPGGPVQGIQAELDQAIYELKKLEQHHLENPPHNARERRMRIEQIKAKRWEVFRLKIEKSKMKGRRQDQISSSQQLDSSA